MRCGRDGDVTRFRRLGRPLGPFYIYGLVNSHLDGSVTVLREWCVTCLLVNGHLEASVTGF